MNAPLQHPAKAPACAVCSSSAFTPVRREHGGYRIVECTGCGVWSVNPVPDPATLAGVYDEGYYRPWASQARARARLWRRRLRLLSDVPRRRLLDVGCGEGSFLREARAAGFQVLGTEISPHAAARTAQWLDVPVYCGDLHRLDLPVASAGVLTFWHVLEHTTRPGDDLAAAHRILEPGGRLVVAVPNRRNRAYRALYRLARRRELHFYHPEDREQHLHHWDPASLKTALETHGFEVIDLRPDLCALTLSKRAADLLGLVHGWLAREPRTNAMLAVARRPAKEKP